MSSLLGCEEEEKLDQIELTTCRSPSGRASRACGDKSAAVGRREERRTCCSLRLVPWSAIRWCRTQSLRGGETCISGTLVVGGGGDGDRLRGGSEDAKRGAGMVSHWYEAEADIANANDRGENGLDIAPAKVCIHFRDAHRTRHRAST
jgi:hypothetical protein